MWLKLSLQSRWQQHKNKPSNIDEISDESSSSDDSETEILDLDDGNSTDESEDETNEESNQPTVSRYGRRQGNWRTRQFMDIYSYNNIELLIEIDNKKYKLS